MRTILKNSERTIASCSPPFPSPNILTRYPQTSQSSFKDIKYISSLLWLDLSFVPSIFGKIPWLFTRTSLSLSNTQQSSWTSSPGLSCVPQTCQVLFPQDSALTLDTVIKVLLMPLHIYSFLSIPIHLFLDPGEAFWPSHPGRSSYFPVYFSYNMQHHLQRFLSFVYQVSVCPMRTRVLQCFLSDYCIIGYS